MSDRQALHDTLLTKGDEAAIARVVGEAVVKLLGQIHDITGDAFLDTYRGSGPLTASSIATIAEQAASAWQILKSFVDDGRGDDATRQTDDVTNLLLRVIAYAVRSLEVHLDQNTGFDSDPAQPGHVGPAEMLKMLDAAMKEDE